MTDAMTNHSDMESLAAFLDGRLEREEREAVSQHLQTCEECQGFVREAAAFEQEEEMAAQKRRKTWMPVAAAVAIVVLSSALFVPGYRRGREQEKERQELFQRLVETGRTTDARFSGQYAYAKVRPNYRGRGNDKTDNKLIEELWVDDAADKLARTSANRHSPADLRAAALAAAFDGHSKKSLDTKARDGLTILNRIPKDKRKADTWNDIATLNYLLTQFPEALAAVDEALQDDPKMTEAMFNRALILHKLGRADDAAKALDNYLATDPDSEWAADAKNKLSEAPLQ